MKPHHLIALTSLALATQAPAMTIGFDDIPLPVVLDGTGSASVTNGYMGLNWTGFGVLSPSTYVFAANPPPIPFPPGFRPLLNSGFAAGVISPGSVAANPFGAQAAISAASDFLLVSAHVTAAWFDDLTLLIEGRDDGALVYSQSFLLSATAPLLIDFGSVRLDSITFTPSGGTQHQGYTGRGTHFALDDLTIAAAGPVPEPASWALMIGGFALAGGTLRRRTRGLRLA